MKYLFVASLILLISCKKSETVLLPKSNNTIVSEVKDWSPIYFFYKAKAEDTIVEVNRNNSIISTNWIFHIDKRLTLKQIIPEIMKLQAKRRGENLHKNENAENYFAYADTVSNKLVFTPFTNVYYSVGKDTSLLPDLKLKMIGKKILFNDSELFTAEKLNSTIKSLTTKNKVITIYFDRNMSYQDYLSCELLLEKGLKQSNAAKRIEIIF